jgi:uncharacterized membrane protein
MANELQAEGINSTAHAANGHGTSRIATKDVLLAEALGVASLGLGIPQISDPSRFVHSIGIRDDSESRRWARLVGVRELAAASGILAVERRHPVASLWSRVAGDAMDLALLAEAWRSKRQRPARLAGAIAAVVGITATDLYAAWRLSLTSRHRREHQPIEVRAAITVNRPRNEVYEFWRDLQNLPRFMIHVESVEVSGDGRSHWQASGPAGTTVEWDARITDEVPNELIAWGSLEGSQVRNGGRVRFDDAPGDRGTEVRLELEYEALGGPLGALVAKLFGEEPRQQVGDDLRRFKQVMETGEIVRSDGTPEGPFSRRLLRQRPAQPLEHPIGAGSRRSI